MIHLIQILGLARSTSPSFSKTMERSINSPGSDDYDSINRVSKERFELAFDKKPHTNN